MPHSVVDDGNLVLLVGGRPLLVLFNNLHGVVFPDDTMAGAYHVDGQLHTKYFLNLPVDHGTVEVQDVGVVLFCLIEDVGREFAVVEERLAGKVLAEAIVGEEDALAVHIGEHGVGPVQHRCFDEGERNVAQWELVAGFHVDEVPVLMVVSSEDGFAFLRAVDGCARNFA